MERVEQQRTESRIIVGRITGVHGIRGEVKVLGMTDSPERFRDFRELMVERPGGSEPDLRHVEAVRVHKGRVLVKFRDVQSRTDAENLVGRSLSILRQDVKPMEEGRYLIQDLLGLTVLDPSGRALGTVREFTEIPENPLLEVKMRNGEMSVPFSSQYVAEVDLGSRRVVLTEAYHGLLDPLDAEDWE